MKYERLAYNPKRNVDKLTPREQSIWVLHQEGKSADQISDELSLKLASVKRSLYVIREKVAVNG